MLKSNHLPDEKIGSHKFVFIYNQIKSIKKIILSLRFNNSSNEIGMIQVLRTITEITASYATRREFGTSKEK